MDINRRTAAGFFDLLNRRNLEEIGNALREDALLLFPKTQPLHGRDRIVRFFQILFRQYPELTFAVQGVIAEGNRGAVHWKNRGMNKKKEPYENEGVTLFEFGEGGIVFVSDFFKDTERF